MRFLTALAVLAVWGCSPGDTKVLALAAGAGSAEPHLATAPDGTTVLSFLEPAGEGTALRYAELEGDRWSAPKTLASGDNWFVNWADFPSVQPLSDQLWAAHWLVKADGGTYAYNAVVAVSEDAGSTWSAPKLLHTDQTATEHGFASLFPLAGGVGAVWLDGRETAAAHHGSVAHAADFPGMQLRAAVLLNGELVQEAVVDDLVCDCCQTDVAVASSGPVAVYRNRTREEFRDIHVARHIEGVWHAGVPVARDDWQISGCPVNGPAITAVNGVVAVAWYTEAPIDGQVNQTQNGRIQLVLSFDSGETFGAPIAIEAIQPVGRVDVALLLDGSAVVSWIERSTGGLMIQRVRSSERLDQPVKIAPIESDRAAGFPQMLAHPEGLVFAWTDTTGQPSRVRSLLVRIFGSQVMELAARPKEA